MAFIETRLSDRVALGFQAVPRYKTRIDELDSGIEKRNIDWTKAKRRYSALYGNFTPEAFAELLACFHACRGSAHAFRFKDWMDFQAEFEPLGNTPGANLAAVQLVKVYSFGSESITRTIKKPVAGTVYIYQGNGAGGYTTKAVTLDASTGLVTPTTNWIAGRPLLWSGEYDVAVRFASDELPSSWDNKRRINTQAELVEDFLA